MSCFFYGTLMHPKVLGQSPRQSKQTINETERVTDRQGHVYVPTVLYNHVRLRIKGLDYPGMIPRAGTHVSGMLVQNLTPQEIQRLDQFEGEEYTRTDVVVQAIDGDKAYHCQTYVWKSDLLDALETEEWDFATFEREKLHHWTGETGEKEYSMLSNAAKQNDGTGGRSSFK